MNTTHRITTLAICAFMTGCAESVAQGPGAVVSWINPTTREGGAPFTTQSDTLIQWGSKAGGPYSDGAATVTFPGTSYNDASFTLGTRCYVAIARDTPVADPVTKAVTQLVSNNSNEVCKTILARPSAPTNLAIK